MEAKLTFGQEVRRRRRERNLSQEALAEKVGVTREAISQIERGKTQRPENELLDKLGAALDLSRVQIAYLLGEGPPPSEIDLAIELERIASLPTVEERAQALRGLPKPVFDALEALAVDIVRSAFSSRR
jgi:transcriptional regulator with XRE-family HTH domain